MSGQVQYRSIGQVAVLSMVPSPGGAPDPGMRLEMAEALRRANADADITAIVLRSSGGDFCHAPEPEEVSRAAAQPTLSEICGLIARSAVPVVALLQGRATGAGAGLALAARYRLADPSARIGFPEVGYGTLPQGAATLRLAGRIGARRALDMFLTGRSVKADSAAARGLIDGIIEGEVEDAAVAFAEDLTTSAPDTGADRQIDDPAEFLAAIRERRRALSGHALEAPSRIVDCVEAAVLLPTEAAEAYEAAARADLESGDQARSLRHIARAERRAADFGGLDAVAPMAIRRAGVLGGGRMGTGVAAAFLLAGLQVTLVEQDDERLASARARVAEIVDRTADRGRISASQAEAHLARLDGGTALSALSQADLIFETVPDDLKIKKPLLLALDRQRKTGSILATNTSDLDLDLLAASLQDPGSVVGLHFFPPAHLMRLVEVVVGAQTRPEVAAAARALVARMGKIPVRAGVAPGYIANRVFAAYRRAADQLIEDGASVQDVDDAMRDFGFPLGPFQLADLTGLDIEWERRQRAAPTRDPAERDVAIVDRLYERGRLGQRVGRGYYRYAPGGRTGAPDPDVARIIEIERKSRGVRARTFLPQLIEARLILAMANEGARLLGEGIAARPSDIDVAMVHGHAFPRWRGGPMMWADLHGLGLVVDTLKALESEDPTLWSPAPVLLELAEIGGYFSDLNALSGQEDADDHDHQSESGQKQRAEV